MSRVDVNKNHQALLQAYKEVSDPKGNANWALFGYEGQTNSLKVVEKGDGGIEELTEELNSGKIMYAYCRVTDPNTGLHKFVFINWQGEGVPEIKKGSCANHITDVKKFFAGAHVTINARTEDDVEEDTIMDKVAKASGANYSIHKETARPQEEAGPVGSVYKKTLPHRELSTEAREDFWEKQAQEEKQRQATERQRIQQEQSRLDKEAKERDAQAAQEREKKEMERLKKIREMKEAEKRANAVDTSNQKTDWEAQQQEALKDEEERGKKADQLRKHRAAEAKALVGQRALNPRNVFEQKPASQFDQPSGSPAGGPPPPRKLKHTFLNEEEGQPPARKAPIELPKRESPSPPASPGYQAPQPPSPAAAAPPPDQLISAATTELPKTRNLLSEGMPRRQDSDEESEDEQNWDEAQPVRDVDTYPEDTQPSLEDFSPPQPQLVSEQPQEVMEEPQDLGPDKGQCCQAIYDYQAAEDNEISFDPGDIISNVEQIDAGWWLGIGPDGKQGMFPSNYVELI